MIHITCSGAHATGVHFNWEGISPCWKYSGDLLERMTRLWREELIRCCSALLAPLAPLPWLLPLSARCRLLVSSPVKCFHTLRQ